MTINNTENKNEKDEEKLMQEKIKKESTRKDIRDNLKGTIDLYD